MTLAAGGAHANIVIGGTRVVYPAKEREVTIKLNNEGDAPALAQVWLDDGDPKATPDQSKAPFMLSPPLFRVEPMKGQSVRLIYTGETLPQDKESLFWFNVLDVPPRAAHTPANSLQLAFRSRIKLFFRPAGLRGEPADAAAKVSWAWRHKETGGYVLSATNPTPFHVTFNKLSVKAGETSYENSSGGMVAPGASQDFEVGDIATAPAGPLKVDYSFINDYGGGTPGVSTAPTL
ncbi:fimbria/pilus periplasmic chaperone [Duganella sp. HSC-15S17]|nr:fimbria/pilus periplasmic chaperone [Duganella violaceicalia]